MTKFNGKKVISMLWFLGAIWGIVLFPRSLVSLWAALVGYGLFVLMQTNRITSYSKLVPKLLKWA